MQYLAIMCDCIKLFYLAIVNAIMLYIYPTCVYGTIMCSHVACGMWLSLLTIP